MMRVYDNKKPPTIWGFGRNPYAVPSFSMSVDIGDTMGLILVIPLTEKDVRDLLAQGKKALAK